MDMIATEKNWVTVEKGHKLEPKKTCNCCGKEQNETEFKGVMTEMGLFFNCPCGSTLLQRISK